MSQKTPRMIAVRDDTVFDDIKVTTYASSEALDAAIAADSAGLPPPTSVDIAVPTARATPEQDPEDDRLIPLDAHGYAGMHVGDAIKQLVEPSRLVPKRIKTKPRVITVPPGAFGLEGIVKKSHTEERDGHTVTVFDEVEVTGVSTPTAEQVVEMLRSGEAHITSIEETFPEGVKVTEVPLNFVSIGEITNPKRDT